MDETIIYPEVDEFNAEDNDTCHIQELEKLFKNHYIEIKRKKITENDEVQCSSLLAINCSEKLAIVLSDRSISIIDGATFETSLINKQHKKDITNITFSPINPELLYTSSLDGTIKLWDIRSNKCERNINFNSTENKKPLTSFDISQDERIICAGTELIGEDSFLLFWDLKGDDLLGGYWNSHSDDISSVKFNHHHMLASSGVDGLLNIFDVRKKSEDDALIYSLNTEDCVNIISWCNERKNILAITDVQSLQFWDIEEALPTWKFSRENITKALRRNVMYECYIVPCIYRTLGKNPIILAGSGLEHSNSCLRTLKLNEKSGYLEPHGRLMKAQENTSITQVCSYCEKDDSFLTVTEDGDLSFWKNSAQLPSSQLKCPSKFKNKNNKKPY